MTKSIPAGAFVRVTTNNGGDIISPLVEEYRPGRDVYIRVGYAHASIARISANRITSVEEVTIQ